MAAAPPLSPVGTGTGSAAVNNAGSTSWLGGAWWQQLQPGSWRGHGFVMDTAPTATGRRIALHEYPYKDSVWPEDLGKLPRRYQIQAFLVGDDVWSQKRAMIAACEQPGPGTLVHPILGSVQVYLLNFSTTDRRDRGRYCELVFEFIDASSTALAPSLTGATGSIVQGLAGALTSANGTALAQNLTGLAPVPTAPTGFVSGFANLAVSAVNDPARALNAVTGLPGLFGRFSNGSMSSLQPPGSTVAGALATAVSTRQAVIDAAASLTAAANAL